MFKPIAAGDLRHVVKIYVEGPELRDPLNNQKLKNPILVGKGRCSFETLTGKDLEYAMQIAPEATMKVVLRFAGDLKSNMYLVRNGRYFYILSFINRDERNRVVECLAVERQDAT